jgi:hypothetical protein
MSTFLTSPSRPATFAANASVSGGESTSFFSHIGAFVGEAAYVGRLIGQALRASRENPEAFEGTGVTVPPWIAWPGDITSL